MPWPIVREILDQLGQGPEGDHKLARLLGEHLDQRAVFQELGPIERFKTGWSNGYEARKKRRDGG